MYADVGNCRRRIGYVWEASEQRGMDSTSDIDLSGFISISRKFSSALDLSLMTNIDFFCFQCVVSGNTIQPLKNATEEEMSHLLSSAKDCGNKTNGNGAMIM